MISISLICVLFVISKVFGDKINLNQKVHNRIVGGEVARVSQFPYAVALYSTYSNGMFFCGGALVSNQWILTAAQCIQGANMYTIYLGSNTLSGSDPNRVTLSTATSQVHPLYNPDTLENDIGLVRFRLPISFNDFVAAVALPIIPLEVSSNVTAIGWGRTGDQTTELSNNLNFVQLITISNIECRDTYGAQIVEGMVCAIGSGSDGTCSGDSGSPMIAYRTERTAVHVATASFTSSQGCESVHPSGYIRTYPYVDWIQNVLATAL